MSSCGACTSRPHFLLSLTIFRLLLSSLASPRIHPVLPRPALRYWHSTKLLYCYKGVCTLLSYQIKLTIPKMSREVIDLTCDTEQSHGKTSSKTTTKTSIKPASIPLSEALRVVDPSSPAPALPKAKSAGTSSSPPTLSSKRKATTVSKGLAKRPKNGPPSAPHIQESKASKPRKARPKKLNLDLKPRFSKKDSSNLGSPSDPSTSKYPSTADVSSYAPPNRADSPSVRPKYPPETRCKSAAATGWTRKNLVNLANALDKDFDYYGFAKKNKKTFSQVSEVVSVAIFQNLFTYSDRGIEMAKSMPKFEAMMDAHEDLKEECKKISAGEAAAAELTAAGKAYDGNVGKWVDAKWKGEEVVETQVGSKEGGTNVSKSVVEKGKAKEDAIDGRTA